MKLYCVWRKTPEGPKWLRPNGEWSADMALAWTTPDAGRAEGTASRWRGCCFQKRSTLKVVLFKER